MSKKKHTNSPYADSKKRMFIATALFCILATFLIGNTFPDWSQIFTDKEEYKEELAQHEVLLEEEASLKSEVTKLQEDEYKARYAREKFYFSKPGELIVRISEE